MDRARLQRVRWLFNTAAYIVKMDCPYSDFPELIRLLRRTDVEIGSMYENDKSCRDFIGYIAKDLRQQILASPLLNSPVLSIMLDSSADLSNKENCNFYIRYFHEEKLVAETKFFGLEHMPQGDAEAYHEAVRRVPGRHGTNETYSKIVGLGSDGASVMRGERSGLVARMKNEIPDLQAVHCIAHNLQLAIGDVCKEIRYVNEKFQPTVLNICKFYQASPRRSSQLSDVGNALEQTFLKIPPVHGVRWAASEANTLKAILKDWLPLVTHLEELVVRNRSTAAEGATALSAFLPQV